MSITRSYLKGMGLTEEQETAIIEEHVNTVNPLKSSLEKYKADAEKLAGVQKELDDIKNGTDWKKKYEEEHEAFESFKSAETKKATLMAKTEAYKKMLKEIGVSDKMADLIAKANTGDIEALELDEGGNIKELKKMEESIKADYSDYITSKDSSGAQTKTPPKNDDNTFDKMTLSDKMTYASAHPDSPEVRAWLGKE